MKEWITLKEAALLAERDESTVRKWIRLGELDSYKIGPSICVRSGAVLKVELDMRERTKRKPD
jgi:excisionase family DNA binding protein